MATEKKIFGGRYQILSLIGEGGMACVYSALDTKLDRKVALKLLHPHLAKNQELRERFYGEAKAISVLNHPNILKIYDFSGEDSEDLWLVTEILTGKTLNEFTKKFPGNKLHPIIATCIIKEITKALIEAHSKRIIHRDIKPENIMILKNGQIKLMDFGIAKNLKKMSMTVTGTFMGSPSYMSPEQIKGTEIDHRTDLYSLGVVFYELLTGELPYQGSSTHEVILKITQADLIPPKDIDPSIPEDLNAMDVKLLSKDPDDRYKKAKNLALDLDTFLVLNGFAESHIELERYFTNKKKFEKRLNEFVLSGWNLGSSNTVNVKEDFKTKKMEVVREVKTIILGENEVRKRVENYNDKAVFSQSRNFDEIVSNSVGQRRFKDGSRYVRENGYTGSNDRAVQRASGDISSNSSGNNYNYNNYNIYYDKHHNNGWNLKNKPVNRNKKDMSDVLLDYYYYKKNSQQNSFYLIGILVVFLMIALFIFGYFALQNKLDNTLLNNKIDEIRKIEIHKDKDKPKKETKKENKTDVKKEKKKDISKDTKKDEKVSESKKESKSKQDSIKPNTKTQDTNYNKTSNIKNTNTNTRVNTNPNSNTNNKSSKETVVTVSSPRFVQPSKKATITPSPSKNKEQEKKVSYNSTSTTSVKVEAKGSIVISSQPAADIYINGIRRGTTIDRTSDSGMISVPSGSYSIELRREGYQSYFSFVKVGSGETKRISGVRLKRR